VTELAELVPDFKPSGKRVRTPTVLQMEAVECGAASLASILAYYRRWVPLEELRVACGVSRDGAKASNVVRAARQYGMDAQGAQAEMGAAMAQEPPFIAFWNFNHFVVVEGADDKRVYLNDPALGPRSVSHKEFSESFTGIILTMTPGPDFKPGGERRNLIKTLWNRMRGSERAISMVMAASLLLVLPGIVLPAFLKTFIDEVLIRGFNDWIFPLIIGLVLATGINGWLTYLQQRYLLRVQTKLSLTSAARFFWHVLRVPVVFYTQRYVGDIASRVQSCHRLATLLSGPLPTSVVNGFMIVFYAFVMCIYSAELTLLVSALTALNLVALRIVQRKRKDLNSVQLNQQAKLQGASMAGLQAIETLKATGTENDFFGIWSGYQTNAVNTSQRLGVIGAAMDAVPSALGQLITVGVLAGGALLIIDGRMTIGELVAFQMLLGHFTSPIQQFMTLGSKLQEAEGDLNRLDDVEAYPIDPLLQSDDGDSQAPVGERMSGAIEVEGLSFGYSPLDPPLIKDFSIKIEPGRRVAFVGASGSGKSTMARLLLGLYQPGAGRVLYDGRPLTEIPRSVFTASVASVDQDISMFQGTVADNLTMWDTTIPREDVLAAARDACIHEDIASRPAGYESEMAEVGSNWSGGQRQRLEIARALVRNPNVVVLDEATSALDPMTEKLIDDNLRRRGCTCVIIAHRLSTIRDCDEIVMLERGQVIERGTHDELMVAGGRYAEMVALQ
jgi:NHLM bacteriocin system ABC transporter peptidase/ATP-binding protein